MQGNTCNHNRPIRWVRIDEKVIGVSGSQETMPVNSCDTRETEMSDTSTLLLCKLSVTPIKNSGRNVAQFCGITNNQANTPCCKPNPFIGKRQIPKGICVHPSGSGCTFGKAGNGVLLQDMPMYYTPWRSFHTRHPCHCPTGTMGNAARRLAP